VHVLHSDQRSNCNYVITIIQAWAYPRSEIKGVRPFPHLSFLVPLFPPGPLLPHVLLCLLSLPYFSKGHRPFSSIQLPSLEDLYAGLCHTLCELLNSAIVLTNFFDIFGLIHYTTQIRDLFRDLGTDTQPCNPLPNFWQGVQDPRNPFKDTSKGRSPATQQCVFQRIPEISVSYTCGNRVYAASHGERSCLYVSNSSAQRDERLTTAV